MPLRGLLDFLGRKKPEAEIQLEEDVPPILYVCISESEGSDLESWRWSLVALDGGQGGDS